MERFKKNIIKKKSYSKIVGGGRRRVDKVDTDGDGKWNIKRVYINGELKKVKMR